MIPMLILRILATDILEQCDGYRNVNIRQHSDHETLVTII